MTLLGGESLLNDATALTAYKVSLGLARRDRFRINLGRRAGHVRA
jgi:NhaP-type Na+/H+ or K+/H+ antiporter